MANQTTVTQKMKTILPGRSLRTQLLITFALTALVAVLVISISSIVLSYQNGQASLIEQLTSVATLTESEINTWTTNLQTDLAGLGNQEAAVSRMRLLLQPTSSLRLIPQSQLRQNFAAMINLTNRFDTLLLLDPDGNVLVSTDVNLEGKNFSHENFFQDGFKNLTLQPARYNPDLGQVVVYVSLPVLNQTGATIGVLAGRANLNKLNEIMLAHSRFGITGESYLVGADYTMLTPSRFAGFGPPDTRVETEGAVQAIQNNVSGSGLYTDYRSVSVIGTYRWIPQLGVALLTEQDRSEAFQGIQTALLINVGVALAAVLVAIVVAIFVTKNISNPLAELAGTAGQIAGGNLNLAVQTSRRDEIGDLTRAFNQMTERLRDSISNLEERVAERTRALEIEAEVSRQIISITEIDRLLEFVVDRLQVEFDYYHTHIYLTNEPGQELVLAASYGEIGRQLKERDHRVKIGTGLVGVVASTGQFFLSNNITQLPNFASNPLLPDTRSELAVPLRRGEQIIGVLDIHSDEFNRFAAEDVSLMQSIANQTAIAVDNARLLEETRSALREVERLNRQLTRESWDQFQQTIDSSGYHFKNGRTLPVGSDSSVWLPPMTQAAQSRQMVKQTHVGNGETAKSELAVPLVLRDQVIGVLGVKRENSPVWADEELAAVEAVADQVARALENARLSKEQEKTIEQLKEVDRLKSEFLTSMSHELRTPLNSIIGFADVLLQGIDGDLPELALNDIQLIYNSGQHLLALINDVLDLSKIEAERMELVLENVKISESIHDVLSASSTLVKNKSIKVQVDIADNLPPVRADKLRLNQVLLNLVSNAAKFTEAGTITIRSNVAPDEPDKMRVAVIDSGIGIPLNKQQTIFDRFRQADSSTTRKYGGTGLGLAICKKLVEMHGGQIGVISEEGHGAEFYFTIPLA
ncbi:MAG: Sensor histidine kinase RcsC [Anaerolineae bacterium]|nr:Sensor histidine kinase RcsC [Anaerolineae bacterium]